MFKKIMITITSLLLTTQLFALDQNDLYEAGFDKLSATQQAEILKTIGDQQAVTQTENIKQVESWVNIGSNIGKGLAGAAKELGVQVNEFAKTDMGQLTVMLIVWHIMGDMIYHLFGGLIVLMFGTLTLWYLRKYVFSELKLKVVGKDKDNKDKYEMVREVPEDFKVGLFVAHVVLVIVCIILIFTY